MNPYNWICEAIQGVTSGEAAEVIVVNIYLLKTDFHSHISSKYYKEYKNQNVTY